MGVRGTRQNNPNKTRYQEPELPKRKVVVKKAIDNVKHHELCLLAAKWLNRKGMIHTCSYVAVELITYGKENPDVIGFGGGVSTLIEVKMSRSDFLADFKKPFRINPNEGMGNLRYYCCPHEVIKENELPQDWGLLYEDNGKIEIIKRPNKQLCNDRSEKHILFSIIRREGIKPQIFDYRTNK